MILFKYYGSVIYITHLYYENSSESKLNEVNIAINVPNGTKSSYYIIRGTESGVKGRADCVTRLHSQQACLQRRAVSTSPTPL